MGQSKRWRMKMLGGIVVGMALLALTGCLGEQRSSGALSLARPGHLKPITIWFDATANWERLGTQAGVEAILDKCVDAGADIVVVDVKPISGYVLFPSAVAPRMVEWKGARRPPEFDLLRVVCEEGHKRGLRVFASMNFFSEGHMGVPGVIERQGMVFDFPERRDWESVDWIVPAGSDKAILAPSDQGVRGNAVFVSAANPEVVRHELAILREICAYPIDGVCLDRVRFQGITADFSPCARRSFEAFLGLTVEHWPEDVFTYRVKSDATATSATIADQGERAGRKLSDRFERQEGPLYSRWLVWRAATIRDVMLQARSAVRDANPRLVFADYTGAWYPDYYSEGANWASPQFDPRVYYAWAPPDYRNTGYAHLLDLLYSGWYYTHVTEEGARLAGVAEWASIEGAAKLIDRVVERACPVHAGLYLFQYKDDADLFRRCMRAAYDRSDGLMLFDLVYLEQYAWWDDVKATFPERFAP